VIIAFVGFGELATAWVLGLRERTDVGVRVYARQPSDDIGRERLAAAGASGIDLAADLASAVTGADVVLGCVPESAASEVAQACLHHLQPGAVYVDVAPADPAAKRETAARMAGRGILYADVALLGTVVLSGLELPMLAAGPGAERWAQIGSQLGMHVTLVAGDAGTATTIKLIRSVYMKGRDALILEMLIAARRHGVEREVIESIAGPGERVSFPALADRVLGALSVHAGRRADELAASARQLRAVDLEPLVTEAGERRLRWMAALGVREHTLRRRDDAAGVLDALDELGAG
jgi:3-hydroxyisobutyrate dehydrogenase-like beta-hydroxyacid dehydrogenase